VAPVEEQPAAKAATGPAAASEPTPAASRAAGKAS
jgi:hypothetical protein